MKKATYESFSGKPTRFAYQVFDGNRCVFTGLESDKTSTINATERIVEAIAKAEGRDPRGLRFFDLQTHRGYHSKRPGEYEFDEITLSFGHNGNAIAGVEWRMVELPPDVEQTFRRCIS